MDLMQNVAKMQSSQMAQASETAEVAKVTVQPTQLQQQNMNDATRAHANEGQTRKIESEGDMENLVKQMNAALDPFRTSLRFGYDDTFYVSVIETKSDKIIRRFPVEQAVDILPKIEDLNGFLFDEKG
ncbi:MAG: flagellar protein FlaG [Sulfurimonadaceae bacterium]|nr:flagellar protein FlaG [Sulfurimonadaceae bacterium]